VTVAINGRAAVRREIGGVERLAREMASRLPTLRPDVYRVIAPRPGLAHRAGHIWEQAILPYVARGADLIYSPANLAPVASSRNAVVIHDVAALRHPEWYGPAYVRYQRLMLPAIARRARLVVTVSQFSKRELIDVLDVPPERIAVVPNGVDERFTRAADGAAARAALALESPYVLTVGTHIARKNLAVLETAARRLAEDGVELVHAGSGRPYMRPEPGGQLRELGYVSEDLLPGLYAGALALAMPSLYEGFGLPCLEAMACGTPVVASDTTALPETCGPVAILVDPHDGAAFADALHRLATDECFREGLAVDSLARAAQFTWERTAELTHAALEVAGGR
jgi:glycosyltransferase involved in cell wall biosynthesis